MKSKHLSLCLLLPVAACATPVTHNTPSGKAEVTIVGTSQDAVSSLLSERIADDCVNLEQEDNKVVCEMPFQNEFAKMMFSSSYSQEPVGRITYNLIKVHHGIRVVADCAIVSNPNSRFENKHDCNQNQETNTIQARLNLLRNDLERKKK